MRRAVVTGAAGFIGSHLSERLVAEGWSVVGIDAFTAYYDRADKVANLGALDGAPALRPRRGRPQRRRPRSRCWRTGRWSSTSPPSPACALSFGEGFARYTADNILATQRVLEAAAAADCPRVVWASSSSVYGDAAAYPCIEAETPTAPALALRRHEAGVRGPRGRLRQRRAEHRRPALLHRLRPAPAARHGDAQALRGAARRRELPAVRRRQPVARLHPRRRRGRRDGPSRRWPRIRRAIYNVGGGHEATLAEVIALLEDLAGRPAVLDRRPVQAGDVKRTAADTTRAVEDLGWRAGVGLREGLRSQLELGRRAPLGAGRPLTQSRDVHLVLTSRQHGVQVRRAPGLRLRAVPRRPSDRRGTRAAAPARRGRSGPAGRPAAGRPRPAVRRELRAGPGEDGAPAIERFQWCVQWRDPGPAGRFHARTLLYERGRGEPVTFDFPADPRLRAGAAADSPLAAPGRHRPALHPAAAHHVPHGRPVRGPRRPARGAAA